VTYKALTIRSSTTPTSGPDAGRFVSSPDKTFASNYHDTTIGIGFVGASEWFNESADVTRTSIYSTDEVVPGSHSEAEGRGSCLAAP
jgi:hypothetical protein